jgi:hypothetical protein
MTIDTSQLESLARDQQQAAQQLQNRINGRINRAMRELLSIARGVVHVRSHDLQNSLYIAAPSIHGEITESNIKARVFYGEIEADRGDEHDYPARTIQDGAAILDELANDVAELIAQAFVGRGSD